MQAKAGKAGAPEQVAQEIWSMVAKDDDRLEYPVNRDAKLLVMMKRWLPDSVWKKMNVAMIDKKPSKGLMAVMRWQINGTTPLEFEPDPKLSNSSQ
jgi:hypothetical protein